MVLFFQLLSGKLLDELWNPQVLLAMSAFRLARTACRKIHEADVVLDFC